MSSDAVSNLHKHAVEVLKRCWEVVPADLSRTQKALNRLLPATGWPLPLLPLDGSSNGTPGSSDPTWLPLPGQQAQVAAMLLQQVQRHILHMVCCLCANMATQHIIALQRTTVWYGAVSRLTAQCCCGALIKQPCSPQSSDVRHALAAFISQT